MGNCSTASSRTECSASCSTSVSRRLGTFSPICRVERTKDAVDPLERNNKTSILTRILG